MSKETPKVVTKKTASAHKDKSSEPSTRTARPWSRILLGVALVIIGVGLLSFGFRGVTKNREFIRTPKQLIEAEVVDTQITRDKGLGGRKTIGHNEGMLFVFEKEDIRHFWMKDMKFSIDIVWMNSAKKVTHIEANVSPSTYPEKIYTSPEPTMYVLELPAGRAAELGITKGVVLHW